jgi:spermidine synthase
MGATLPFLSKFVVKLGYNLDYVGSKVGGLYAINTFGAVAGTFLAGFIFIPKIGVSATNLTAAFADIILAGLVFVLRRPLETIRPEVRERLSLLQEIGPFKKDLPISSFCRSIIFWGFGFSGLAAMIYQVLWSRVLSMIIGSSIYSFTIILLTFLVGISLGSGVFSGLLRRLRNPASVLGLIHLGIGLVAIFNFIVMDELPLMFARSVTKFPAYHHHVGLIQFIMFLISALVIFPSTFGMGAVFPLTLKVCAKDISRVGKSVGSIYAVNTIGAIIGSFISGFILIPNLGLEVTMFIAIGINLSLFFFLFISAYGVLGRRIILAFGLSLGCILMLKFSSFWDLTKMTLGVFRLSIAEDVVSEKKLARPQIVFYKDSISTTVSVEKWRSHYALKNNGKVEASNGDDMPTQIMVSAYPLLLHPRGGRDLKVAIVGFGSGVTLGSALKFPVSQVDIIELEPEVVRASQFFMDVNQMKYGRPDFPYLREKRVRVISDDARSFFSQTRKKYDVIISEPSNPWITGVSNLFTQESFKIIKERLKNNGLFCQWVQLYEMSPKNIKCIFRTFLSVFRHMIVFSAEDLSADTILVGSNRKITLNLESLSKLFKDSRIREELSRAYIFSPYDIFARVLFATEEEVKKYTQGVGINTDDNVRIEFEAPRDLIGYKKFRRYLNVFYGDNWPYVRLEKVINGFGEGRARALNFIRLGFSLIAHGRMKEARKFFSQAASYGNFSLLKKGRAILKLLGQEVELPLEFDLPTLKFTVPKKEEIRFYEEWRAAVRASKKGKWEEALKAIERIPKKLREEASSEVRFLEGFLLYQSSRFYKSIRVLENIVREDGPFLNKHPEIYYLLGHAHDAIGTHLDKTLKNLWMYVELKEAAKKQKAAIP